MNSSYNLEDYCRLENAIALDSTVQGVTRAIGRTTPNQLRHDLHVTRPSELEKNKDDACHSVRSAIQRKFIADRLRNRDSYADYIQDICGDRPGATPPITLYCSKALRKDPDDHTNGGLYIARGACVIAIDGETQLDAWWDVTEKVPDLRNKPIGYIMHAGLSLDEVRVIVHDLNALGRPIKEGEVAALNTASPIVRTINEGILVAGVGPDEIDRSGDGFGTRHLPKKTSFQRLAALTAGVYYGPERIGSRTESFLSSFRHPASANGLNLDLMREVVAAYLRLSRETLKRLGKSESKAFGTLATQGGAQVITEARALQLLANKQRNKGKRGTAALNAMIEGIR